MKKFRSIKLIALFAACSLLCGGDCQGGSAEGKRFDVGFGMEMPMAWDYTAGTFLVITAAGDWTLSVVYEEGQRDWTTLEETHGTGDAKLWFTTTQNNTGRVRTAVVTVACGRRTASATVIQGRMAVDRINSSIRGATDCASLGWDAPGFTVDVATGSQSTAWSVSVSDGEGWCMASGPASGMHDGSVAFDLAANTSRANRSCTLRVASDEGDVYLKVQQRCRRPELPAVAEPGWFRDYAAAEYALEYSIANKSCKWVAWTMHAGHFGAAGRNEEWRFDTSLSPYNPVHTSAGDYTKQKSLEDPLKEVTYSRGHMCPSNDRTATAEMNRQTFCYANMMPQLQNFNAGIWSSLESRVHGWASVPGDTLYVCAGGYGVALRTAPSMMAVPRHYFKVILRKRSSGEYDAVGFWMEHKTYGASAFKNNIDVILRTVREVEALTGLDFFHDLDPAVQEQAETRPVVRSNWGLPN